jgi:chitinase
VTTVVGDPTDSDSVSALAKGEDVFIIAVGGADNTVWLRAAQTVVETLEAIPRTIPRILHMGGGSTL